MTTVLLNDNDRQLLSVHHPVSLSCGVIEPEGEINGGS